MTKIMFSEAKLGHSSVFLGIAGPSGAGKTKSALRVASGLKAPGGTIYMIDTEGGRGLHYAAEFKYQYAQLVAPFTYERYRETIEATAAKAGDVVIVDSASHGHEGEGGLLDQHEAELKRMAGDDYRKREQVKFAAWIDPKKRYGKFVAKLTQLNVDVIFCFRAKDKMEMVKKDGKNVPVSVGWQPITTEGLAYEMTAMLVLPPGSEGRPDLAAQARKLPSYVRAIFTDEQLSEETGVKLKRWAHGGAEKPKPEAAKLPPHDPETGEITDTDLDTRGTDSIGDIPEGLRRDKPEPSTVSGSGHDPKILYANDIVATIQSNVSDFLKFWYGLDDDTKFDKLTQASYQRIVIELARATTAETLNSWAASLTPAERELMTPVREQVRDALRRKKEVRR